MSETKNLQFVDNNVLICAHDLAAGQKHVSSRELVHRLWQTGNGCLSIQVLQEFYVSVTQKVARPLLPGAAGRIIADMSVLGSSPSERRGRSRCDPPAESLSDILLGHHDRDLRHPLGLRNNLVREPESGAGL